MKRIVFTALIAVAITVAPAALRAQVVPTPPPTPAPDPMVYRDDGMHFRAPAGFLPVGQRHVSATQLGEDPTILAGWIYPNRDNPRRIVLEAEAYQGDVTDFDGVLEQQMRSHADNAFFKDKQHISLKNGMPAMFVTMTAGEGFSEQKMFIEMWADGTRGVAIILQTQLGDISPQTALRLLSDVSAVRYPTGRL